jgi:hypothetical protein
MWNKIPYYMALKNYIGKDYFEILRNYGNYYLISYFWKLEVMRELLLLRNPIFEFWKIWKYYLEIMGVFLRSKLFLKKRLWNIYKTIELFWGKILWWYIFLRLRALVVIFELCLKNIALNLSVGIVHCLWILEYSKGLYTYNNLRKWEPIRLEASSG